MERRSFVIGLGALSAGGVAALGTGAFSSAEAARDVSVELADDADAYLALESTSEYAVVDEDGVLELDFGQDLGEDLGEHVGEDSFYQFGAPRQDYWVFAVRNQGTQTVEVSPGRQTLTFDADGDPDGEDTELIIDLNRGISGDPTELAPGEDAEYLVQISTGDDPPDMDDIDPEDAIFEINANEV